MKSYVNETMLKITYVTKMCLQICQENVLHEIAIICDIFIYPQTIYLNLSLGMRILFDYLGSIADLLIVWWMYGCMLCVMYKMFLK